MSQLKAQQMADYQSNQRTEKTANPITDALLDGETKGSFAASAHETSSPDSPDNGRNKSQNTPHNFLSRLTANQWLTFLVGVGSLVVSYLTYKNASDTSDIQSAISKLSELAAQTKRQADAVQDQLGAIREQVIALREQTEAIKASADAALRTAEANILAANAQRKMAEITEQAQKPEVDLLEVTINGLNSEPIKNGLIQFTLLWHFRNTGGSALTVKDVNSGVYVGESLPETMPGGFHIEGAGMAVINAITSGFTTKEPLSLAMTKDQRDELIAGKTKLFFFARFEYFDTLKVEHARCFGRQIFLKDGNSFLTFPSGGPAYQCAT